MSSCFGPDSLLFCSGSFNHARLNLPLHEIPLRSPVAEIIKRRKDQGRDSFEILWDGRDGLKTSVVPADLVERACPEKITEFEERRKMKGKKRNNGKPKARKTDDGRNVDDIGRKLQDLVLEIEQASDSSRTRATVLSEKTNASLSSELVSRVSRAEVSSLLPTIRAGLQHEVIDLLSPSPAVRSRVHIESNCDLTERDLVDSNDEQQRGVIYLSDSENDVSPEHVKKARELRLFLARIQDDNVL